MKNYLIIIRATKFHLYIAPLFKILELSMRASRDVSWANQILHVHFKSTNHNH